MAAAPDCRTSRRGAIPRIDGRRDSAAIMVSAIVGATALAVKFDVRSVTGERKTHYETFRGGKRDSQRRLTKLLDQVNNELRQAATAANRR